MRSLWRYVAEMIEKDFCERTRLGRLNLPKNERAPISRVEAKAPGIAGRFARIAIRPHARQVLNFGFSAGPDLGVSGLLQRVWIVKTDAT